MFRIRSMLCAMLVVLFAATLPVNGYAHQIIAHTQDVQERLQDHVKAGVSFLDERRPGWDDYIILGNLNMHDGRDCILGQLYGYYKQGLRALKISDFDANELGFMTPGSNHRFNLWIMWENVIRERRKNNPLY